jgi:hypothetical protein
VRTDLIARILVVAVAVWLMAAPSVLGYGDPARTNDRIIGPIAGAFAFVACWQILMAMRWPTLPLGLWLVVAPLALDYDSTASWVSSIASGVVIAAAAFVGRDVRDEFGGGWRSVRPKAWRVGATRMPGA